MIVLPLQLHRYLVFFIVGSGLFYTKKLWASCILNNFCISIQRVDVIRKRPFNVMHRSVVPYLFDFSSYTLDLLFMYLCVRHLRDQTSGHATYKIFLFSFSHINIMSRKIGVTLQIFCWFKTYNSFIDFRKLFCTR